MRRKRRRKNRGSLAERMSYWSSLAQEHIHSRTAVILPPCGDAIKKRHYLRIFTHFWQARRARDGERERVGAQTKATFTSSPPE